MGCCADLLANERKGEANMNRLIGSEINVSLDEENINKENQNNNNEESENYQQNNINLFDLKPLKHEKRVFLRYKYVENEENEENNLEKIREDEINNKIEDNKLSKNEEQIIPRENKNLGRESRLPFDPKEVEDQLKFNKDSCKSLASSLPKRTKIEYQPFKDLLKSKTENLSDKEKSFVIFLWICDNIAYDADSYYAGTNVDCTPKGVYKNGSSICAGYSRLYKDFADYLNLEVECVPCYAKGEGYYVGQKLTKTDHEYNVIKLNNKWYPIDSTWGAGHVDGEKFFKSYNEFYFLANPELLIKSHFPADDKWQLTKKTYTLEEFLKWPQIESDFYTLGFEKYFPEEGLIELKNKNILKFIVYGNNMDQKGASCNIYLLEENSYVQQLNVDIVNFYKDRFEVSAIFNKKGKYKVVIYGNNERGKSYEGMLKYAVNVENNAKKNLKFPTFYAGKEDINVIEPLYDNLKSGEKVKFKIESTLNDIIIIDDEWHYLKRNEQGYFEFETIIKTKKGKTVEIVKKTDSGSYLTIIQYNVV